MPFSVPKRECQSAKGKRWGTATIKYREATMFQSLN